jgi:hypothetical protein
MEYYRQFPSAILRLGVRSIALLTLSPLALAGTFDLHVLAMPPAFNLSHDQTLQLISVGRHAPCGASRTVQWKTTMHISHRRFTARANQREMVAIGMTLRPNRSTPGG